MLCVSLLGGFRVIHGEAHVTAVDTPRLQALLAHLILNGGVPQSRAHLAFLFWPDTTEAQARTNLRNLLHHLRHALPNADAHLAADSQTLQWRTDVPFWLDVDGFERGLSRADQAAREGDPTAAQEALEQAAALYQGDLLPSCYDDWIVPRRESLRQANLSALERLVSMAEERCDYRAAIGVAERLLRHDPLHEATYRHLMRLHALEGDRAGALRVYHACATALRRELDVEPGPATRLAYEQILGAKMPLIERAPAEAAASPLFGRETEWKQMLRAWRAAAGGGTPHAVLLCGEAGIGKTRLVEQLLQWASRQGISCAAARCYAAEGALAYAPVTAWLRSTPLAPLEDVWLTEVGRLLPEALAKRPDLPRPGALTEAWQRQRLFEALARAALGMGQPLLLVIDDLQWCDRDTLEWTHFLLRFDRRARLLFAGSYRPEEIGEGHPLTPAIQALRLSDQVTEIELQPLDETATQALASHIAGRPIDPGAAERIYHETEGNPLFVVETVRAELARRSEPGLAGAGTEPGASRRAGTLGPTPKVQAVLEARLAQLSAPARELAGVAAAIGREFSFQLLARASSHDEDFLVRDLDELWHRRIVREHGRDAYDFSHDKLREAAYLAQGTVRRRMFHRAIAEALRELGVHDLDTVSHQVAAHYERAGMPEEAAPYYLQAALVARRVYANPEAIALLRQGLAVSEEADARPDHGGHGPGIAARLWEELGDLLELKADHDEALQAYDRARVRLSQEDQLGQARLHRKAATVRREQRLYSEATDACNRAEAVLREQPAGDDDSWWGAWLEVQIERVWVLYWSARWRDLEELVRSLQPVMQSRGGGTSRMRFLWASCLLELRMERYRVSDSMLADALEGHTLCQALGTTREAIDWEFEIGFLHLWRRELQEAERHLGASLELSVRAGVVPFQTLGLTYLTVVQRFRGLETQVAGCAQRSLEAAEEARMPDYVAAARGNLAWLAWRRRDLPAAETMAQAALAIWRQSPLVYPFQWLALWPLAAVLLAQGREDEAWAPFEALLEPTQQRLPDDLNSALESAILARSEAQAGAARLHLDRALTLACEMGYL
ncbi:MAG TPA: BTAD domain-containing putative transcriptional regulator [Anaerolineae bacterium]|nr:BTAD domain-containing putative transcriptional regulator [Anaerolineae bacterium]